MKILLEYFENAFPEKYLFQGEIYFDENKIQSLIEIEKHLWIGKILDQEVEILISPTKLKKYTCDCENFRSDGTCEHIVAVLYQLRKLILSKRKKKVQQTETKLATRFNIKQLLQEVSHKELELFVINQARKNKSLSNQIKARFARRIEFANDINKYQLLLDDIIKPVRTVDKNLKATSLRAYVEIAKEFLAQTGDLISLKEYKEAYHILVALIKKNAYVQHHQNNLSDQIESLIIETHQLLEQFISLDIAPELRKKSIQFIDEMIGISYYSFESKIIDLYSIAITEKLELSEECSSKLTVKLGTKINQNLNVSYLFSRYFELIQIAKHSVPVQIIEKLGRRPEGIKKILSHFQQLERFDMAQSFIDVLEKHELHKKIDLRPSQIEIHLAFNNESEASKLIHSSYLSKGQSMMLEYARKLSKSESNKLFKSLEKDLLDSEEYRKLQNLYLRFEKYDSLINLITERLLLDVLKDNAIALKDYNRSKFEESYKTVLIGFSKNFVGQMNAEIVSMHLRFLKQIGENKLAGEITNSLKKEFKKRKSIQSSI